MPTLILFAGPNGSGKSSVTRRYQEQPSFPTRYINADEIAKTLTEGTQEERERTAFRTARQLRQDYREAGESFAFETVFSHPSTLLDMANCRTVGFTVHVVFVVTTDVRINIARIQGRVKAGGHDVPEDKIRSRYERSLRLLPRIVEQADIVDVFDNSERDPILLLQKLPIDEQWRENLPPFWEQHLRAPLMFRQREHEELGKTLFPDETAGTYFGTARKIGQYYLLQETEWGTMCHDRLLLVGADVTVGQNVTISYKEMQGKVQSP
jgi:predicted ABC-type ATPase